MSNGRIYDLPDEAIVAGARAMHDSMIGPGQFEQLDPGRTDTLCDLFAFGLTYALARMRLIEPTTETLATLKGIAYAVKEEMPMDMYFGALSHEAVAKAGPFLPVLDELFPDGTDWSEFDNAPEPNAAHVEPEIDFA